MSSHSEPQPGRHDRVEEAIAEYLLALDQRQPLDQELWLDKHAEIRQELQDFLALEKELGLGSGCGHVRSIDELDRTTEFKNGLGPSDPSAFVHSSSLPNIVGPYRITRMLGAGGMGRVFEAVDPSGNLVALKLLSPRCMNSPESLQRFKQEGKIASSINHPRCVFVKAADEDGGQPYIVMELMTGQTLKDLCHDGTPISVPRAINAIVDVLDGLNEAHLQGMIHRDIKPANCYLELDGRVKVGDFGLARSTVSESELTQSGEFIGTPLFASPEQVKGLSIDARSDIYSVCATLYFLLTGRAPFAGTSPTSVIAKIVSEDPQPIRDLNPSVPILLERIIMKGLQRDRKLRYQSIAELRLAVEPFVSGRQSIAAWGRRFAAYGLDSTITGAFGAIAVQFLTVSRESPILPFWMYACVLLPIMAYHFAFEGIGNATLGKRLLRLQVVSQNTGEKPSRWRLIVRSFTALMLMGVLTDLLIYTALSSVVSPNTVFLHWTGYAVCYAAMFSPLLFTRRGRLLLHDWLSGTMVVDRPSGSHQQQLAIRAAEYHVPLLASKGYPTSLGGFEVTGLVCSSDDYAVLEGRDARLERNVWLHLRPLDEAELSIERRECDRLSRVRWLTSGKHEHWRWDAYVACQGAPLKHWTTPGSALSWQNARGILKQLVEELDCSAIDGTTVRLQSLDQIWMDTRGRIAVLDWSPLDASLPMDQMDAISIPVHSASTSVLQQKEALHSDFALSPYECAALCETLRLALCGVSRPLTDPAEPVRAIVPLHARELIQSLTDGRSGAQSPTTVQVLNALESSSQKPAETKFENRVLGLAFALIPGLMMLGIVASLSRLGNQVVLDKIADRLVAASASGWLLNSDDASHYAKAVAGTDNFPSREEIELWLEDNQSQQTRLFKEYRQRFAGLGPFSEAIAGAVKLVKDPIAQLDRVRFEWEQNDLVAVNWKRDELKERVDLKLMVKQIRSEENTRTVMMLRRSPLFSVGIMMAPFLIWILWAGFSKGGVAMRVSGLCIVGANGKPASWPVSLLRAFLIVFPLLVVQFLIAWIDLFHPDHLWLSVFCYQILLWMFLVYAILAIAFPRQTPADWLLGTNLVPR